MQDSQPGQLPGKEVGASPGAPAGPGQRSRLVLHAVELEGEEEAVLSPVFEFSRSSLATRDS